MFPTNIRSSTAPNQAFQGTASNDWLLYTTSNQSVWIGTTGNQSNAIQITPTLTQINNLSVTGTTSFPANSIPASAILGSVITTTVSTSSNILASTGTFSNLTASNITSTGTLTCSNIKNRGRLLIFN